MAYQNVGTPRFYINIVEWLKMNNAITLSGDAWDESIWNTLPVIPTYYASNISEDGVPPDLSFPTNVLTPYSFLAILGHDMPTSNPDYGFYIQAEGTNIATQNVVNSLNIGQLQSTVYNGFSIGTFNGVDIDNIHILAKGNVGSMVLGTYYDMPHSPDLNLTMTREYGGVKTIETKGGASLSNTMWSKPPKWGDSLGAWELSDQGSQWNLTHQPLSRSGRRVWDLSFSYLDDGDVFGPNQSITSGEAGVQNPDLLDDGDYYTDPPHTNTFRKDLLTDDNFYSQVIHKTNGLPFIFQADKNNSNPDSFAICKFDMKEFKFEQVANGVYNMKLKIREVW